MKHNNIFDNLYKRATNLKESFTTFTNIDNNTNNTNNNTNNEEQIESINITEPLETHHDRKTTIISRLYIVFVVISIILFISFFLYRFIYKHKQEKKLQETKVNSIE